MFRHLAESIASAVVIAVGLLIGGCTANKKAGRLEGVGGMGFANVASSDPCRYHSARAEALVLIEKASEIKAQHPERASAYQRRASEVISSAEACQKRRGR